VGARERSFSISWAFDGEALESLRGGIVDGTARRTPAEEPIVGQNAIAHRHVVGPVRRIHEIEARLTADEPEGQIGMRA
jgi:hypothetical protein